MMRRIGAVFCVFAAGCVFISGCGSGGPATYHVNGTVTFNGKPVPAGRIDFLPDFSKKNDGPQGFADIHDGTFDTRKGGQGHAGGAIIVKIEGFDGKSEKPKGVGNPLFSAYEKPMELPNSDSVQSFDVPAGASKAPVSKSNPKS
jgi:hypothetical protein